MSYTNVDLIRNHIEFVQPISNSVYDQIVLCDTDSYINFFSGTIIENSAVVKAISDLMKRIMIVI